MFAAGFSWGALGMAGLLVFAGASLAAALPVQAQTPPQVASGSSVFTVLIDASHGGSETGTLLAPGLVEKDLVLALSVRLRSALTARGIHVVTTREGDSLLPGEARASAANHAHAAACLLLHATANGAGLHIYTSSLAQGRPGANLPSDLPSNLPPWTAAGAPYITDGLKLASEITNAAQAAGLPYTLGRVRIETMDAMRCPSVAVEVAPLHPVRAGSSSSAALSDPAYQSRVVDALAAALVEWRSEAKPRSAGR